MNITEQELNIITHTRGKILNHKAPTGENLFLVWGYPTVIVFLVEFAALILWDIFLCEWLWAGIPLVGVPLMIYFQQKDYNRLGFRSLDANIALQLWLFIGAASALSGFTTGIANVYEQCYCIIQGLLIGMGCFLTGVISRFRPMKVCGIAGSALSFTTLLFQGDLWPWQLFITALIAIVALIIPGHLLKQQVKCDE